MYENLGSALLERSFSNKRLIETDVMLLFLCLLDQVDVDRSLVISSCFFVAFCVKVDQKDNKVYNGIILCGSPFPAEGKKIRERERDCALHIYFLVRD